MKQLLEFEKWIDTTIQEANTIGAPMKTIGDRPIPRSQDIQYQASLKYPDRSSEQALQLYVADKMKSSEEMDLAQNKLINAQKKENEKLRRSLQNLDTELSDHERQAKQTDVDVARLKDLSSKLKPAGELQQQTIKADTDKVEAMLRNVEELQNKPGVDNEKFKELQDKVEKINNTSGLENADIEKVQQSLNILAQKQQVSGQMFDKVMLQLEKTQKDLEDKEIRFQKSTERNRAQKAEWGTKFADLNKKIQDIESKATQTLGDLTQSTEQAKELSDRLDKKTKELSLYLPVVKRIAQPDTDTSAQDNIIPMAKTAKRQPPKFNVPDFPSDEIERINVAEDLRRTDHNAAFVDWVEKYTPYILNALHRKYPDVREKFNDKQAIEGIYEYMPALWAMDEITQATMDDLLDVVYSNLHSAGPQPMQQDLFPKLDEAYENILDNIIGLPEIFKKHK